MKQLIRRTGGYAVLLAFVLSLTFSSGCTSSPQRVAYQVTATTRVTVQMAMELWGAYVGAVHPPAAQEEAVKTAYEKWQASMVVVCDAGAAWAKASALEQPGLWPKVEIATTAATAARTDLINLISAFGVKF